MASNRAIKIIHFKIFTINFNRSRGCDVIKKPKIEILEKSRFREFKHQWISKGWSENDPEISSELFLKQMFLKMTP